jgi:hypothetical protein
MTAMGDSQQIVERRFLLSSVQVARLQRFAEDHQTSEDAVVGRALDILFGLTESVDEDGERRAWSALSGDALGRVWDNEDDARYDAWRELYGVPAG